MQDKWCSIDEIASYLDVRRETIYKWIKQLNFPVHKVGTLFKVQKKEVDIWITSRDKQSFPPSGVRDDEVASSSQGDITFVDRREDFERIFLSCKGNQYFKDTHNLLLGGDSLSLLKKIPAHSISLIVTDPPYHSTQKENIMGDTQFKEDGDYLEWMDEYVSEWARVLRPNGSIYCFCSASLCSRLEVLFAKRFNVLSSITWTKPNAPGFDGWKQKMKKESLRQWYDHSERIIFAEPAFEGNLFRSYFGTLLQQWRKSAHLTMKDLAERIGAYGKVNHGGSVANWEAGRNIPSLIQYQKIVEALKETGKIAFFPPYSDAIRPFHVSSEIEFTDVWQYPNIRPYKGKHPAEKPITMLEEIIKASSNPGDIVLDCFSGSGTTAIAALKNRRMAISMEIDPKWLEHSSRIFKALADKQYQFFPDNYHPQDFFWDVDDLFYKAN